jgi:DNA-binding NarL/FixJ family response regulator
MSAPTAEQLNVRELQVLHGIADGRTNAQIGSALGLCEDTVKVYARRLRMKLGGARDRAHAVYIAWERGLLSHARHTPPHGPAAGPPDLRAQP